MIQSNPPNSTKFLHLQELDFPDVTPAAGLHLTTSDHVGNWPATELMVGELMVVNEPSNKQMLWGGRRSIFFPTGLCLQILISIMGSMMVLSCRA
jgi:hypothetical protein